MGTGLSDEDVWAHKTAGSKMAISKAQAPRDETEFRVDWRARFL